MTLLNSHPLVLDKQLALVLGLNEALILQQVHYWIGINKKAGRNFHQGKYWTYNSINEWKEEFPFWSNSTIKRTFKRLRDMKLIEVGNFNVYQMDRTLWYTINYEELQKLVGDAQIRDVDNYKDGGQNESMEGVKKDTPLPKTTSKTNSELSSQSIYQCKGLAINNSSYKEYDRLKDVTKTSCKNFQSKYKKILADCEIDFIDVQYRKAVAHAIKLLLLDMDKNRSLKLGHNYIPVELVEKDIKKLNFFTIEHAVTKFKEASKIREIRNPVAYLKVLIYNSINEVQIDMDSKLRYKGLVD